MTRTRKNGHANASQLDPGLLLARGFTARYLGVNLKDSLTYLSKSEIERDIQHLVAYEEAATRYRQVNYANYNRIVMQSTTDLPVKIDPEEEKRSLLQRKRIQRAEAIREELEQHYVSLRAHYVLTSQTLKHFPDRAAVLHQELQTKTQLVGLLRSRLQMGREILACLQARHDQSSKNNMDDSSHSPLLQAWTNLEDTIKAVQARLAQPNSSVEWQATQLPTTPYQVPLLLSCCSSLPDKGLAYSANGILGQQQQPNTDLVFFDQGPEDDHDHSQEEELLETVRTLENELQEERKLNETLLMDAGVAKQQHDQWVSMMSIVRTETEAILHRHNVLLENCSQQPSNDGEEEGEHSEEESEEEERPPAEVGVDPSKMEEEDGLGDDWSSAKRGSDEESPGRSKRRKL